MHIYNPHSSACPQAHKDPGFFTAGRSPEYGNWRISQPGQTTGHTSPAAASLFPCCNEMHPEWTDWTHLCFTKISFLEPPWPWPHLQDTVQVAGVAQVVQAHKRQHVVFFLTADKGGGLCCRNHLVTGKQRTGVRNTLEKPLLHPSPPQRIQHWEMLIKIVAKFVWIDSDSSPTHPKPHRKKPALSSNTSNTRRLI